MHLFFKLLAGLSVSATATGAIVLQTQDWPNPQSNPQQSGGQGQGGKKAEIKEPRLMVPKIKTDAQD